MSGGGGTAAGTKGPGSGSWWWTDNGSKCEEAEETRAAPCGRGSGNLEQERFVSSWLEVGFVALIPQGVPAEVRLRRGKQRWKGVPAGMPSHPGNADYCDWLSLATVADALAPWQREQEIAAIIEDVLVKCSLITARGLSWSPTVWDLKAKQAAL